ncbi:hypothetical protein D3C85_1128470 [compost metagenome]
MVRFCVVARTNRPSRVRFSTAHATATTASAKAMMTMRLYGITRPAIAVTPPLIQLGLATSTFWAPKMVRTACISSRLIPKVASSVSSGRPYRWRSTIRSMAKPTTPAARNDAGSAASRYQSNALGA